MVKISVCRPYVHDREPHHALRAETHAIIDTFLKRWISLGATVETVVV